MSSSRERKDGGKEYVFTNPRSGAIPTIRTPSPPRPPMPATEETSCSPTAKFLPYTWSGLIGSISAYSGHKMDTRIEATNSHASPGSMPAGSTKGWGHRALPNRNNSSLSSVCPWQDKTNFNSTTLGSGQSDVCSSSSLFRRLA